MKYQGNIASEVVAKRMLAARTAKARKAQERRMEMELSGNIEETLPKKKATVVSHKSESAISFRDLRKLLGVGKANEIIGQLLAAQVKPVTSEQLILLRRFSQGQELGKNQPSIILPMKAFIQANPKVAAQIISWCDKALEERTNVTD